MRIILPGIAVLPSTGSAVRIAFVGDTTIASVKDLARRIARSDPAAVIFCGDAANELPGTPSPRQFRRWAKRWGDLGGRVLPVPGNHDYGPDGSLAGWWEHAASRLGGAAEWFDRRAFVLRLPEVSVFGLDCGPTGRRVDQAQLDWMTERALEDRRTWTIVAMHGPVAPVSLHMNAPMSAASREAVGRFVDAAGAQLVVSGHEHLYARADAAPPLRAQVVVGGGGAALYPVVRGDLRAAESRHHHLIVDAGPDALRGVAVSDDGERIDAWEWGADG